MGTRLTLETATALAVDLRAAVPLVQVRQAGRIAQEMTDPDIALVVRALADLAAQDVALPAGHLAAVAVSAGPSWWAALLVAETVNHGHPDVGTLAGLLDGSPGLVAWVMIRLLSPADLVRGVPL